MDSRSNIAEGFSLNRDVHSVAVIIFYIARKMRTSSVVLGKRNRRRIGREIFVGLEDVIS